MIVKNFTDNFIKKPFLTLENPTMRDFEYFLANRVFPKERENCKDLLRRMEIPYYSPYLICTKTLGVLTDDHAWIRFEGDTTTRWEDINPRMERKRKDE